MKNIEIKKDYNIKIAYEITNFITPTFNYVLIKKDYSSKIKDLKIYKEQVLFLDKDNKPIIANVSGNIVKHSKGKDCFNNVFNTIIIKNDFKEEIKHSLAKIKTANDLNKLAKNYNICSYNNSKQYLADILESFNKADILVVSCLDDEPYFANKSMILQKNLENLLQTIDKLRELYGLKKVYLLIRNTESNIIKNVMTRIGTFLNIQLKLIPDYYGYGNNYILEKIINNRKVKILNIGDILILHNLLIKRRLTTKKYVTISGNEVENPQVINVKIGTNINDVLKKCIKFNNNANFIVNGLINGQKIDNLENLIVTWDFDGLIISKLENYKKSECINCGLCYLSCPINIDPRKNIDDLCLHCNLCNYICPAHLNIKENLNNE